MQKIALSEDFGVRLSASWPRTLIPPPTSFLNLLPLFALPIHPFTVVVVDASTHAHPQP